MLLKLLVRDFADANHKDTWKKNQGNQHQVEPPNQDFIKLNFYGFVIITNHGACSYRLNLLSKILKGAQLLLVPKNLYHIMSLLRKLLLFIKVFFIKQ